MSQDLSDKIVLITGTSRGIGRAAALACAHAGAELIITARTVAGLEELDDEISKAGGQAAIVELDQSDHEAMPRLAQAIGSRWGRLDGFIANAGQLGQMGPLPHIDSEVFERTIDINLVSIWHQIAVLDPLLRQSPSGRAVLVSSGVAHGANAFWGGYAVSKAGLEAMGRVWAAESEQTNLRINMLNPGGTKTAMRAAAFPGENPDALPTPEDIAPAFVWMLSADCTSQGELYRAADLTK